MKVPIAIVVVKGGSRFLARQRRVDAFSVGEVNVRPPVAIIVNESNASAHRLDNVFLLGARKMIELDAGRIGDVFELRQLFVGGEPATSSGIWPTGSPKLQRARLESEGPYVSLALAN